MKSPNIAKRSGLRPHSKAPAISAKIISKDTYVDTLKFLSRDWLDDKTLCVLQKGATSIQQKLPSPDAQQQWAASITIQQPTSKTFQILEKYWSKRFCLNRVDLTIDYIMPSRQDANELKEFLWLHLVQKWPGRNRLSKVEGTYYWSGKKWTPRNFAVYSDKSPKKSQAQHCCHFELRLCGAQSCRRKGIRTPIDLLNINFRGIFQREISLWELKTKIFHKSMARNISKNFTRSRTRNRSNKKLSATQSRIDKLLANRYSPLNQKRLFARIFQYAPDEMPNPNSLHLVPIGNLIRMMPKSSFQKIDHAFLLP